MFELILASCHEENSATYVGATLNGEILQNIAQVNKGMVITHEFQEGDKLEISEYPSGYSYYRIESFTMCHDEGIHFLEFFFFITLERRILQFLKNLFFYREKVRSYPKPVKHIALVETFSKKFGSGPANFGNNVFRPKPNKFASRKLCSVFDLYQ